MTPTAGCTSVCSAVSFLNSSDAQNKRATERRATKERCDNRRCDETAPQHNILAYFEKLLQLKIDTIILAIFQRSW
jgi:hypothetical protein